MKCRKRGEILKNEKLGEYWEEGATKSGKLVFCIDVIKGLRSAH
jgi:hypothetical protein